MDLNRNWFGFVWFFAIVIVVKSEPSVELPIIKFNNLMALDESAAVAAANALVTIGALQITNIPDFATTKEHALENLADCLKNEPDSFQIKKSMLDGSMRLTSQAANAQGQLGKMSSDCGADAKKLRSLVDATTRQLFLALDTVINPNHNAKNAPIMTPYKSYDDLMRNGEHLEHLHAFYSGDNGKEEVARNDGMTVDFHTDSGLLIAMTTGYYAGEAPSEQSGLYIQLPTGAKVRAAVANDALIIMVGDGGARWLSPISGAPLRAVPHAVVAGLKAGSDSTRSWYGKMYLPPSDAIIPQEGISFARYQQIQSSGIAAAREITASTLSTPRYVDYSTFLPSACGGDSRRFLLDSSTPCTVNGEEGIICWMTCMSVENLPCGQSAECVNPDTGEISDGNTDMCASCVPECVTAPTDNSTTSDSNDYCYGLGVSMYMQGFVSTIAEESGSTACVNLLFLEWTLDNSLKFGFACFGVLLLGILVQYLTAVRVSLAKRTPTITMNIAIVIIHSVQVLLGYFLMLIAMTYNVELFCMVILGLSIGFALFNLKSPPGSTDACCPPEMEDNDNSGKKVSSGDKKAAVVAELEAPLLLQTPPFANCGNHEKKACCHHKL